MNVVYIDAGNTRLKYSQHLNGGVSSGVVEYRNLDLLGALFGGVDRLYVSMVGSEGRKADLDTKFGLLGGEVFSLSSQDMAELVDTNYEVPSRMGIDRWLAIYSILDLNDGYSVVVDAGTALTIDVLDHRLHLGGYIVPGYSLQLKSMALSAALPEVVGVGSGVDLGLDTVSCMRQGVWVMLSSFVVSVVDRYPGAKLYLTGGDAGELERLVSYPCVVRENLVIDGLIKFGSRVSR